MNAAREALDQMGKKILNNTRTQLYLSMHFMGPALSSLDYIMDLATPMVGTDGVLIRFNPNYLMQLFLERPRRMNRTYIHMLMHCLFLHMYEAKKHDDPKLWDLCCDIAVESVIDTMGYEEISDVVTDHRNAIYDELTGKVGVLTAEKLYRYFSEHERVPREELYLAEEFGLDDHSFWLRIEDTPQKTKDNTPEQELPPPSSAPHNPDDPNAPEAKEKEQSKILPRGGKDKQEEWKKNAKRLKTELDLFGKNASEEVGSLERMLSFELAERRDFRDFLKRFFVLREEAAIDMDSFDYGFYNYGMELYGNMPLIEENEYREMNRIEELVIAIDTSASTQDVLVQKFLNDTASIILSHDNFFHKVNIHIVECDDRVQNDIEIHDTEEMKRYAEGFSLKGGFGTDFRPVFRYVEELREKGVLKHLKGLLYFTDGFGTYPKHPTDYDTAFVFHEGEEFNDKDVPSWALKLYI